MQQACFDGMEDSSVYSISANFIRIGMACMEEAAGEHWGVAESVGAPRAS